jgi:hypothetical protein
MSGGFVAGMRSFRRTVLVIACAVGMTATEAATAPAAGFDHAYQEYAALLARHVRDGRVDYRGLVADRAALAAVAASFGGVDAATERAWPRDERLAFWINAYNLFTLQAIVDHYPIQAGWFTLGPRNSIRQIGGVWDRLTWRVAGRQVTLDDIEHRILRPEFKEPRIHFAVNCASVGCPPLRSEPYRAGTIGAQLDANARAYLASPLGLRVEAGRLMVTSILTWYGGDFIDRFGASPGPSRTPAESAILRIVEAFGPSQAATLARDPAVQIGFLDYDWTLNDVWLSR